MDAGGGTQLGQQAPGLGGPSRDEQLLDGLRLRVDVAEHLGQTVVHLARDPFPLGDDGELAEALLEPRVLQRDRRLVGERRERLDVVHPEAPLPRPTHQDADRRTPALERRLEPGDGGSGIHEPADSPPGNPPARSIPPAGPPARQRAPRNRAVGSNGDIDVEQLARLIDDRLQDLVDVDEGGDRHAHPVQRAGRRHPHLELGVAPGAPRRAVDAAEGDGRERPGEARDDDDHEDGVEREREGARRAGRR